MATAFPHHDYAPIDPAVDQHAMAFLRARPGIQVAHSGSTLFDHLTGVYDKLKNWECRPAVCLAGLYHSVYGTESFRKQTLTLNERPGLESVIGGEAENLAYRYCELSIREFIADIEQDLNGPDPTLRDGTELNAGEKLDLVHMFLANWLEQMPRLKPLQKSMHASFVRRVRPLVTPKAREEIERTYEFDTPPRAICVTANSDAPDASSKAITILDDFVPAHLRLRLTALSERNIWRYGWKASPTQTGHRFWHSHFAGDNEDSEASCETELHDRPLVEPIRALWELIRDNLATGHVPVRVYANGHTFGEDGHFHTDSERAGHFTSIYYAHAEWHVNWGGETVFFDQTGEDVVRSVYPKPGRLVHFPGTIPHAARSPGRDCPALRAVFVIKTFCPLAV